MFALLPLLALAEEPDEAPVDEPSWHRHSLGACLGNRCGGLGPLYVFRLSEQVSFSGGVGLYGAGVAARLHPAGGARSVYLSAGLSPVFAGFDGDSAYAYYGLDVTAGGEWRAERLFLTAGGGVGLAPLPLQGVRGAIAVDLAVGVNFSKPK